MNRAIVEAVLDVAVVNQPWYKRYAGTVTAAASGVVALGTWVTATWTDLPASVATVLGVVVLVASILAQRATKNGLTPRGNTDVADVLDTAADVATETVGDLVDFAKSLGWTEHDPRYIGMTAIESARAFLESTNQGRHQAAR